MKKQIRQIAIVAVEETTSVTPEEVLRRAIKEPESKVRRIAAVDYVPAMEILIEKGYAVEAAAKRLIELGCPFAWKTLDATFRSLSKNYAARPQAKKRDSMHALRDLRKKIEAGEA